MARKNRTTLAEVILVREKLSLLAAVNTFQPIVGDDLVEVLSPSFGKKGLSSALASLLRDKLVAQLKDGTYYATKTGLERLGSGPLAGRRDRSRMLYISSKNKEGSHKA